MTGYALATALAAPVDEGMMLAEAARPACQSAPFMEPSTVSCEAVAAWTVVIRPCLMPNFSLIVLTSGARPLVVHEAQETTAIDLDSQTYSTPVSFHGISVGSRVEESVTGRPLMERPPSMISQVPGKRPWTVSCSSRYFMYSGDMGELMCLSTNDSRSMAMRTTWRPMRPKPLTPSLIGASGLADMIGEARPSEAEASESMIDREDL